MSYNGFEIDMLNIGDADCILVTEWKNNIPTRVLIDGGNTESAKTLKKFLRDRDMNYIDHVVCTHPHDDHAGGLVELLADTSLCVGRVWVHRPQNHLNMLLVEYALNQTRGLKRARVIQETLETVNSLTAICTLRGVPVYEPFAGQQISCLTVVGPSVEYYTELVAQFADASKIRASQEMLNACHIQELAEVLLESKGIGKSAVLLDNPETQPENNSSVILATMYDSEKYLFTSDAGAQALTLASEVYDLEACRWMQIPHHGSRRNITESLIRYFRPKTAFVSAAGNRKHPRRAVVNAFKKVGTRVYSTHYPNGGHLWHYRGEVPPRSNYSSATALWEA